MEIKRHLSRWYIWITGIFFVLVIYFFLIQPIVTGFYFARSGPLFDALMCVQVGSLNSDLHGSGLHNSWACEKGVYLFRGSAEDAKLMNSDYKYLFLILDPHFDDDSKKMFEFWLAHGADINAKDPKSGATMLFITSDPEKVAYLLAHGARTDIRDNKGRTALDYAHSNQVKFPSEDREKIVKLLSDK
jgi:hypothetical protein